MLVHTVLFWLKDDLTENQKATFFNKLEKLKGIECASTVYIGTPSTTPDRPVIDTSYDACLTVLLESLKAHDAYQIDPLHTDFLNTCKPLWEQVKIYDAD